MCSSSTSARKFQWALEALHYLSAHPKSLALKWPLDKLFYLFVLWSKCCMQRTWALEARNITASTDQLCETCLIRAKSIDLCINEPTPPLYLPEMYYWLINCSTEVIVFSFFIFSISLRSLPHAKNTFFCMAEYFISPSHKKIWMAPVVSHYQ